VTGRLPSDALIFFGATGDLAYKQIFPALQGLVRKYLGFHLEPEVAIALGVRVKRSGERMVGEEKGEPATWGPIEADRLPTAAGFFGHAPLAASRNP
jgi:glucose-6-phosphate 1-dehydrogenase